MSCILLVEDNEFIMDINYEYLKDSGYDLYKAYTLKQAEDILNHYPIDVIVLDIMMPDGDGIDFCQTIKQRKDIPVLFLSAKSYPSTIVESLEKGGDDFLPKPYDLSVLEAKIKVLLRRIKNNISYQITSGHLTFDLELKVVYFDDEMLPLTNKEYMLLLYLIKNQPNFISKEDLYEAIWGQDIAGNNTALWTAVSRLKKKIEPYKDYFQINSSRTGYQYEIIKN